MTQPSDYGNDELSKLDVEKLFNRARLSEVDREIVMKKLGEDWTFKEIANHIGKKFMGRTDDNPIWEGTVRYRMTKIVSRLRKLARKQDFYI